MTKLVWSGQSGPAFDLSPQLSVKGNWCVSQLEPGKGDGLTLQGKRDAPT
jgi:hypothetical protein